MSYHQSVSYDRDLDPDLRGNVDFNFFGDDEEDDQNAPSNRVEKSSGSNSRQSGEKQNNNNNNNKEMRKSSSTSHSLDSSSDYSDKHSASRSPAYQRDSIKRSDSESDDTEHNRTTPLQRKPGKREKFDAQSPLSTPRSSSNESSSSRSRTLSTHSSASSSRAAHKSSSPASSHSSRRRISSPQGTTKRSSKEYETYNDSIKERPLSAQIAAPVSSFSRRSSSFSRAASSSASSASSIRRASSAEERRSISPSGMNRIHDEDKLLEDDGLSEVTEVSPLTSPEFVSPIGSPQTMRRKNKAELNAQRGKPPIIDFSTRPRSRNSRASEKDTLRESINPVDEDKLDISLLLSALSDIENKPSLAYKPRGDSGRPAWVDPNSKNHTFSKLKSWEIEKENQRLLQSLLTGSKGGSKKTKKSHLFPGGENVAQLRRPHHSTLNRQRQQRQIEIENQYILSRIRSVGPTQNITRDYLLKSYSQQMQYGVPSMAKKPLPQHVITRDPVTYGLGGYRGARGRNEDELDSDDRLKRGGRRSNTHRGMGDNSSQRQQELRATNRRRPQSANAASRGSNAILSPSNGYQYPPSQNSASSHRRASDRPPSGDRRQKTSSYSRNYGSRPSSRASSSQGRHQDESDTSSRIVSSRREWLTDW